MLAGDKIPAFKCITLAISRPASICFTFVIQIFGLGLKVLTKTFRFGLPAYRQELTGSAPFLAIKPVFAIQAPDAFASRFFFIVVFLRLRLRVRVFALNNVQVDAVLCWHVKINRNFAGIAGAIRRQGLLLQPYYDFTGEEKK